MTGNHTCWLSDDANDPKVRDAFQAASLYWDYPRQELTRLDDLLTQATESPPLLRAVGEMLADLTGGRFVPGNNKTRESAENKIAMLSHGVLARRGARQLTDYCRGVLLFDDNEGIRRLRKVMKDAVIRGAHPEIPCSIVRVRDRYAVPTPNGLRGVFMEVRLPNRHITEIQGHTTVYWNALQDIHSLYKQTCAFTARYGSDERMIPAQEKERYLDLMEKRSDRMSGMDSETGADLLDIRLEGNADCSWPRRHRYEGKSGKMVTQVVHPDCRPEHWEINNVVVLNTMFFV